MAQAQMAQQQAGQVVNQLGNQFKQSMNALNNQAQSTLGNIQSNITRQSDQVANQVASAVNQGQGLLSSGANLVQGKFAEIEGTDAAVQEVLQGFSGLVQGAVRIPQLLLDPLTYARETTTQERPVEQAFQKLGTDVGEISRGLYGIVHTGWDTLSKW